MSSTPPALNYAPCTVRHLRHNLPSVRCQQCGKPARRVWEVSRSAIDIDLDHPVLLLVSVSVHRCGGCSRYFRADPRSCARTPSTPSVSARRPSSRFTKTGWP